jgi:hypothetical protein
MTEIKHYYSDKPLADSGIHNWKKEKAAVDALINTGYIIPV